MRPGPVTPDRDEERRSAREHPERVVLDIGGDVGALIVHTDAALLGVEVEISPTGADDRRSHKDVLQRQINGRPAYTAVFDRLREGTYTLWVDGIARARRVAVGGATIAELDWSGADWPGSRSPERRAPAPDHSPPEGYGCLPSSAAAQPGHRPTTGKWAKLAR